jgi:Phage integrase family
MRDAPVAAVAGSAVRPGRSRASALSTCSASAAQKETWSRQPTSLICVPPHAWPGELCALRKSDIDMEARTVRVERSLTELQNGALAFGPPKSDAGRRTVGFPELIAPVIRWHLSCFAQDGDDGLVFTGPAGALLRRGNFRRRTWLTALKKAELPTVHFHDLRHTGNNLTATAGANLRELMARMGHSSTRAALIYLHSTDERQREIADALGDLAAGELKRKTSRARKGATGGRSGTQRARRRKSAS